MEIRAIILFYYEYNLYCDLRLFKFIDYYIVAKIQTLNSHEHGLTDMNQFLTLY